MRKPLIRPLCDMMNHCFALHSDTEMDWNIALPLQGLSHMHCTSAYDAAYIELAERRGLPFLTLDQRLEKVGKSLKLRHINNEAFETDPSL